MIEPALDGKSACLLNGKPVMPGKALDTLKSLAVAKKLPFAFDPFIEGVVKLCVEGDGDGCIVSAQVLLGKRCVPLEECTVYSPYLICDKSVLQLIDCAVPIQWFDRLKAGPIMLMGEDYKAFYQECGPADFPRPSQVLSAVICDAYGANLKSECREWLEEIGYSKQGNVWICPLPEASDKLKQLIELGFSITQNDKPLILQTHFEVDIADKGPALEVSGRVYFEEEAVSIIDAMRVSAPFIDLGSSVGLLDPKIIDAEFGQLKKLCIAGDAITVPKVEAARLISPTRPLQAILPKIAEWIDCEPNPNFTGSLHTYQKSGLSWLSFWYRSGLGGILADEMGLGKTVQVLALFSLIQSCRPTLIVMPTSLLGQWKSEFSTFLPNASICIHSGSNRDVQNLQKAQFVLTTYGTLLKDSDALRNIEFELIVLDEAHIIKNPRSQTFSAAQSLQAKARIALTGTPIQNSTEELQTLLTFCIGTPAQRSEPFILRRTKDDAGVDLPDKIEQDIFIDLEPAEQAYYDEFETAMRQGLVEKNGSTMEILEGILRLRQLCCHPDLVPDGRSCSHWSKFDHFMSDVEELVADGRKILIYSQFTSVLDKIEKRLSAAYLRLDGQTKNRADLVERYQTDPQIPIFLISLKAGGVGLNLTAADYVLLYDPWWNNAIESQAIDRAHRLGRKGRVIARRYYTNNTIESKIEQLKSIKDKLNVHSQEPSLDELKSLLSIN
ncbi:MAG: DEAD/DEAH box helicase [Chlamydiales bacterium]|nr:DEAD/DEAH box helicase [Chlamydiales bacterium]